MSTKIEIRSLTSELRAEDGDKFQIVGTAAAYNSLSKDLGGFREIIRPGAFKRALSGEAGREGEDVKCLFNHDYNHVLGRSSNGTLKLSDSASGLRFRCQLDPNQQSHRDLHASIKRGDVNECSFAFAVAPDGDSMEDMQDEKGQRYALRTLRDCHLFDVSPVTNPAYGRGATNVSARSADYTITKHGDIWSAELGPQGERLLSDPWAAERAQLAEIDDRFLRQQLARVGDEIARERN
jgi:HK97 family phage prohead protease